MVIERFNCIFSTCRGQALAIALAARRKAAPRAQGSGGHGLGNMQSRAEAAGATLMFEDAAPGLRVRLTAPLTLAEGEAA